MSHATHENLVSEIITFTNHPTSILHPERVKPFITTIEHKLKLLGEFKSDYVTPIPFSVQFANLSAEEFLKPLNVKALVLGHDAKIGKGRSGDPEHLHHLSKKLGFSLTYLPPLMIDETPISSTRIRVALEEGKIDEVNKLLGRAYSLMLDLKEVVSIDNKLLLTPPPGKYHCVVDDVEGVVEVSRSDNQTTLKIPVNMLTKKCSEIIFLSQLKNILK